MPKKEDPRVKRKKIRRARVGNEKRMAWESKLKTSQK